MAASHLAPVRDMITIREAVAILELTGHPVSYGKLARALAAAGTRSERHGRTNYYSASDITEVHRDLVDQIAATR